MGRAGAATFQQQARDVTHVQVEGVGHYPAEQAPGQTGPAVVGWLCG